MSSQRMCAIVSSVLARRCDSCAGAPPGLLSEAWQNAPAQLLAALVLAPPAGRLASGFRRGLTPFAEPQTSLSSEENP
eukprot:8477863-Pyramimonas_sp.AAC.1